ncbi:unnamed protein product, partial [Choristocarpus tenellus]
MLHLTLCSPSGTYFAPPEGSKESFVDYIKSLPFNEGPEVFGLHANANISCALSETNSLLDTALSLQPRSSGGSGKSWDEMLGELTEDISTRLPPAFDIERALLDFPVRYEESMNTVLTQELIRFNRLRSRIAKSLAEVKKALKGLVVMSSELEQMGNSMVVGKVPTLWSAVAYPSLMPLGSWVTDFLQRLEFLGQWMENGNYARKHQVPIDKVAFDYRVLTPEETKQADKIKAKDGAFFRGLFIEGARWNVEKHTIDEARPRELFVSMPYMHLLPQGKDDISKVTGSPDLYTGHPDGTAHMYMCPVYKTSVRQGTLSTTGHSTNFVMFITIP